MQQRDNFPRNKRCAESCCKLRVVPCNAPCNAELSHFTSLFCRVRQRNVPRIMTHVHSHCFCSLNLLFSDVPDAVAVVVFLGTVYTNPVSFVTASLSTRLSLSFTRRRSKPVLKPGRFENALKSGAFSKRYGFTGRVNGETDSI